ncbi:MAG TPA: hypothetical protein O0X25_00510 [Methanocorpusculum sp.]|nr:hypothetical protein [Methanocorpusculum sp.]HJJ39959.1 hypothetical protein [Methanocorpusculum sp.]HJJ49088.1 hypothetical protein [Methanocorpusculum sp.]HJJ56746.1 hypothetical protein [Methanocorpusculum sp.]
MTSDAGYNAEKFNERTGRTQLIQEYLPWYVKMFEMRFAADCR